MGSLALFALGATAVLLDGFTTWFALHSSGAFSETAAGTAALIDALGLIPALILTAAVKLLVLGGLCFAIRTRRFGHLRVPLSFIGILAVAVAWGIVIANLSTLSA